MQSNGLRTSNTALDARNGMEPCMFYQITIRVIDCDQHNELNDKDRNADLSLPFVPDSGSLQTGPCLHQQPSPQQDL